MYVLLTTGWDSVRLFLHITAATVWVGGQLTLAALVPALRNADPAVPKAAARAFNRVAWPAYGVLLVTGAWNVWAERDEVHGTYQWVLTAKITMVALSGLTAWLHSRARSRTGLAVWGALTGITALGAVFLGVVL
jgi:putative copper export protein